jgi:hypothetical protein
LSVIDSNNKNPTTKIRLHEQTSQPNNRYEHE